MKEIVVLRTVLSLAAYRLGTEVQSTRTSARNLLTLSKGQKSQSPANWHPTPVPFNYYYYHTIYISRACSDTEYVN